MRPCGKDSLPIFQAKLFNKISFFSPHAYKLTLKIHLEKTKKKEKNYINSSFLWLTINVCEAQKPMVGRKIIKQSGNILLFLEHNYQGEQSEACIC